MEGSTAVKDEQQTEIGNTSPPDTKAGTGLPSDLPVEAIRRVERMADEAASRPPIESGRDALRQAEASAKQMADDERQAALAYLLADDDSDEPEVAELRVNVGSEQNPKWIRWALRAIDGDTLMELRRTSAGNRAQRRAGADGAGNELEIGAKIVAEATVFPDLIEVARQKQVAPHMVVRHRFTKKPGIITQLVAEVMAVSGFENEDVQPVDEVKATGN